MGYTLAEVNDIIVENELLRDQIKDLETYNQELRDLVREFKAQLDAKEERVVTRHHQIEERSDGTWTRDVDVVEYEWELRP